MTVFPPHGLLDWDDDLYAYEQVAHKPDGSIRDNEIAFYVDGRNGNDSYDGRSWGRPKKTINAALAAAPERNVIFVGDMHPTATDQGTVVVNKQMRIVFTGDYLGEGGGYLIPASDTADVLEVAAHNVVIENLKIQTITRPNYTGRGFFIDGGTSGNGKADNFKLKGYHYLGPTDAASGHTTLGGTGLWLRNCGEGHVYRDVRIQNANTGWKMEHECSFGSMTNLQLVSCYKPIEMGITSSFITYGWIIIGCKAVQNTATPASHDAIVLGAFAEQMTWINCDWVEWPNQHILVAGDRNIFIKLKTSPQSVLNVTGDQNYFLEPRGLGQDWFFEGAENEIVRGRTTNAIRGGGSSTWVSHTTAATLNVTGSDWIYDLNSFSTVTSWGTTPYYVRTQSMRTLTYGTTVNTSASGGSAFKLTVTNTTPFTMANPTNSRVGQEIIYDIINASGGTMGAITWGSAFKLAGAFTNPTNGLRRTISFYYDGTNWVETSRAAANI
jgi:hypothetical protein